MKNNDIKMQNIICRTILHRNKNKLNPNPIIVAVKSSMTKGKKQRRIMQHWMTFVIMQMAIEEDIMRYQLQF